MADRRKYEETHPWITFKVDLEHADPELWLRLGEAASKIGHISGVPLKPDLVDLLHRIYLVKGVHATTAIEGNTLTEQQVADKLDGRLELQPSSEYLGREVQNIANACKWILDSRLAQGTRELTSDLVKEFHRRVLEGIETEDGVVPGEIRLNSVGVARYRGAPHEDCEYLVDRLCTWLSTLNDPRETFRVPTAIIKAILSHLYLAWIHPFGDGNGRTARLMEFDILLQAGVPSPAAHLLSNHYNLTRAEYYRQLERASASGGDVRPFLLYAVRGLVDQLRDQLKLVRGQQLLLAWTDYVNQVLRKASASTRRQKDVVFALTGRKEAIPIKEIPDLSAQLAREYMGRTKKTLTRDVNALQKMNLLDKRDGRVRAKVDLIGAFLPQPHFADPESLAPLTTLDLASRENQMMLFDGTA